MLLSLRVTTACLVYSHVFLQFIFRSTKVKADEVSMRSSVVRVNFEFEARDSTHQDWNEFHFHQEEEYDGWEVTSNIRPSGIELAPNLRLEE